jgi:hypothetical protein
LENILVPSITSTVVADYLILLLFTGLRKDEAASLEWDRVKMPEQETAETGQRLKPVSLTWN